MHGMIDWFARNQVAANLLMLLIIGLGLWALAQRVPLEVFPEFERDIVSVTAVYRGATPVEIEESVVIRIEEAIADLEGIARIDSTANEGHGQVSIEVEGGWEPRDLLDDIKNRVDAINTFPIELERPTYQLLEFKRQVISLVVSGDLPERELRRLGELVRDDLQALPGLSLVELTGVRPYEISIEVRELTLDQYGLTFDQIVQAVRGSSLDVPAGSIKTQQGEILLRTKGQRYSGDEFKNITLLNRPDGSRVTIGDLAEVKDGFEEESLYAKFNGRPAVFIEVYRTGAQSALEVAATVKQYIAEKQLQLPAGVTLDYWQDGARIVKLRLNTLLTSAWQGGVLVFICLALFLRLSVAIWVCVGIPISFLGALALMPELGVTINLLSLFGFILVLGIVVDDAIVTGENIYTHIRRGEPGLDAAINGAQEVAVPVTFGLLTTACAFIPLLMMEGTRALIFKQIPLIVIPVLIFSWVESRLILPAHMSHVRIPPVSKKQGYWSKLQTTVADGLETLIATRYQPLLIRVLQRRYLTLMIFTGFTFVVLSYVLSGHYGFTFFPRIQSETARATLNMQSGTTDRVTARHIENMTRQAEQLREKYRDPATGEPLIRNILSKIGWTSSAGGGSGQPELGEVTLELEPTETRTLDISTAEVVKEWRELIGAVPGARELNYRAEIGRGGDPINVQLTGQDFAPLRELARKVKNRLGEYPGVFDIQDNFEDGKPEIKLELLKEAELLGISSADLGRQVRQAFFGAEAQRFQRNRDDVRVMIRYPLEERRSLNNLNNMRIRTAQGAEVPIVNVAEVKLGQGFSTIRRTDRQRIVNVTADLEKEQYDINSIARDLSVYLDGLLKDYPGVRYSFEGELSEQEDSFRSLTYGALFTLFSIYALLAIPLRSYSQPLVVMLVIPFSTVGAILGHMLLGVNLSLMSIMGIVALAGVVVNDSLVLVDWINQQIKKGISVTEAVSSSGAARFRPILLTSLTTFAGLTPLIWEKSTQAQFLIPMAISLGFGVLYATLLSLVLVPAGYLILDDAKNLFKVDQSISN